MSDGRLPERLAQVIAERHCSSPGLALPSERRLAAELGASRAMVREALAILRAQGRITGGGGHPAVVADALLEPVQPEAVEDAALLEARCVLEGEIAALAAARAGLEGHARLREALRLLWGTEEPLSAWRAEAALHRELLSAAGNPALERLCQPLLDAAYAGPPPAGSYAERLRAHQRLVAAIGRQQPQLARDLLIDLLAPRDLSPTATSTD